MDRAIIIFLSTLTGLGLALVLLGWRRRGPTAEPEPGEESKPWRGTPRWAIALAFTIAALPIPVVLLLAGPILALAAGILLFGVAALALRAIGARHERRIHDEALVLADTLVAEMTLGLPLPDALGGYVRRHPRHRLAGEVQRFVLDPLHSGESLVALLNTLAEGPRYRAYTTYHRLLLHLARAVRGRLTPEEMEHSLRTFLGTSEMVDEVQQELAVDITQTQYTRWTVIAIIGGGILFVAVVMPDARQHWLHDLVGQITMLLVSLSIAWAVGMGEALSRIKGWRF